MAKQGVHPSGRVVSVRLDEETIERLDNLSERTGRSRGFYLKLAIRAMLPAIEQKHWEHAAAQCGKIKIRTLYAGCAYLPI